jgi:uncharacterized protein YggE
MRALSLLLISFLAFGTVQAQDNTISINSSATVDIPADQLVFNININAESESPQEAFKQHQKREQLLVDLLKEHQIEEENISFQPISISNINTHRNDQEPRIRTRQQVSLTLSDFDRYEEIQIALIEGGYDDFSGQFISTESDNGKDQALKDALNSARQKAELIAEQSGLSLTGIHSVDFSYNQSPPRPMMMEMAARDDATGSLISEYAQTVSVSASVSVRYNFMKVN